MQRTSNSRYAALPRPHPSRRGKLPLSCAVLLLSTACGPRELQLRPTPAVQAPATEPNLRTASATLERDLLRALREARFEEVLDGPIELIVRRSTAPPYDA